MSSHSWRFYHRQSVFFSCETVWYSTKIEGISIEALVSCHGNPLTCMKHFTLAPHASKGPMPTTLSSTNFFGTGKKPRSSFPAKALLLYSLYIKPASLFFVPFFFHSPSFFSSLMLHLRGFDASLQSNTPYLCVPILVLVKLLPPMRTLCSYCQLDWSPVCSIKEGLI